MEQNKMEYKRRLYCIAFFGALCAMMLSLLFFSYYNSFFYLLYKIPSVQNGVLDLQGYDLKNGKKLFLDGQWHVSFNKWVVSEKENNISNDGMATVPGGLKGEKASYTMLLKNCPEELYIVCDITNIAASYNVFINNELVSSRQAIVKRPKEKKQIYHIFREPTEKPLLKESEIVIELYSPHIKGLYVTPYIMEKEEYKKTTDRRYIAALLCIGILGTAIVSYSLMLFNKDNGVQSVVLLFLDIFAFLRLLTIGKFYELAAMLLPIERYYIISTVMEIITLFFPVLFFICAKELIKLPFSKKIFFCIVQYQFICGICMILFSIKGFLLFQKITFVFSCLPYFFVFYTLYQSVKKGVRHGLTVSLILILLAGAVIVINVSTANGLKGFTLYPSVCVIVSIFLQANMYIRENIKLQKEAAEAARLRLRLKDQELSLMLQQIKPHFLYNTLIAIHMLCTEEPETAAETVLKFANYLRMNMGYITSREPILFSQELKQIKNYVDIEKLRFQKRLTVEYEISAEDFYVPPLTIQPFVENAIKHGACKNVEGGTVWIRSYEKTDCFCIEVTDNGPGFDYMAFEKNARNSQGLKNVLFRLKELTDAEVVIKSREEEGTSIFVSIPKKGWENAHSDCR